MNLAEFSIKNQVLSVIVILLTIGAGWNAYQHMPRFEAPEFIIRTAQIIAQYPGANPIEVAEEITEVLEREIMQLQEVDAIESISSTGVAELQVDITFEASPTRADLERISNVHGVWRAVRRSPEHWRAKAVRRV